MPDLAWSAADHLEDLQRQLELAQALAPLRVTVITGSDSLPAAGQLAFLPEAVARAHARGLAAVPFTHPTLPANRGEEHSGVAA